MKHIAIIWASFAGLSAYLVLRKQLWTSVKITLIDQRERFTYIPSLHETLFQTEDLENIQFDLATAYGDDFLHAKVENITKEKVIRLGNGEQITPDYLIIATWSRTNYFGKIDFEKYSYSVRHPEDIAPLNKKLQTARNITVIWWWVTGVELASIIADRKSPEQNITLIHSRDRTFHNFHEKVSEWTERRLQKHWCQLILWDRAQEILPEKVVLSSWKEIESDCTILSSGIKINDESYNGQVTFETSYDSLESDTIYYAGDVALHGLYTTAHNAMIEGRHIGKLVADHIQWIETKKAELENRKEVAIALWPHDGIITNWERWRYFPFITWFAKKVVEKRVILEFKKKILLPL